MNTFDYITDILLIAVVFRQIRTRELTLHSLLLPVGLVATASVVYLRPFPVSSGNITLAGLLLAVGAAVGTLSGLATSVWRQPDGSVSSRAGLWAALAWTAGMGARFAFAVYSTHWGATTVTRFSVAHDITGAHVWQTTLVLMAIGEVLARVAVLQLRRQRLTRTASTRLGTQAMSPTTCP